MAPGLRRWLSILLVAAALPACDSKDDCRGEIERLELRLGAAVNPVRLPPSVIEPIEGSGAAIEQLYPLLIVTPSYPMTLNGTEVAEEDLASRLGEAEASWSLYHPNEAYPHKVHVWADRNTEAVRLERMLAGVNHQAVLLMVDASRAMVPSCPSRLGPVCAEIRDPAEHRRVFGQALYDAVHECDAFDRAVSSNAMATLLRAPPNAIRQCGCDEVDLEAFEYIVLKLFEEKPVSEARVNLRSATDGQTIGEWVIARATN